ncbi:hypothetical protein WAF17_20215 [Bernardetia sp. ABR2-2B]|uniref:hypothetical protein n=1 Tax=Bernardetia sp. ABR2-2B TaxID=3127472 RepID=UPI0030D01DA0
MKIHSQKTYSSNINLLYFSVFLAFILINFSSCQTGSDDKVNEEKTEEKSVQTDNTLRPNLETIDERTALIENGSSNLENNFSDADNKKTMFSEDELDVFSATDSSEFFARFAPKTQTFEINNNGEGDIFCDLGTYIHIDSGSFYFKDGSPITEPVVFEVKEFYDKSTVLLSGLTTNTEDGFLESGGMLHLKATSDGKEVSLKKEIDIELPSINTKKRNKNGMSVYLASSNAANANLASNPPSSWTNTRKKIRLRGLPPKRDFYHTISLSNKEQIDKEVSNVSDCECGDVEIVLETVEALSENLDVAISKEHTANFRKVNHRKVTGKNTFKSGDYYYNRNQRLGKDTTYIEYYSTFSREIYPSLEDQERYVYDTIKVAVELGKKGTGLIVEELYRTNNALTQTNLTRSVNSGAGLRFTTQLSTIRSCSQDKKNFYVQSLDIWKDVLEKGEDEFRTWKKTQRRGEEESYTISYKKRKNPILIWTAIVQTTAKPFKEDYKVVRRREYFLRKKNETMQARYDAYRQKIIDRNNEIVAKNAGNVSAGTLESYVMSVSDLGWINCDRFYSVPKQDKVDLLVNSSLPVRVIFNNINSVMKGSSMGGKNLFPNIPKNEPITVFGIRKKEDKIFMALQETKVSTTPIDLKYREVSFKEMQEALTSLNQ